MWLTDEERIGFNPPCFEEGKETVSNNVKYFYGGGFEIEERALSSVKGEMKLQDSRDREQDVLYGRKNHLKCKLP